MTQLPTPVRLRQGESISLLTGQVEPSTSCPRCWALPGECACPVAPANRDPWTGLDRNNLCTLGAYLHQAIMVKASGSHGWRPTYDDGPVRDGMMDY